MKGTLILGLLALLAIGSASQPTMPATAYLGGEQSTTEAPDTMTPQETEFAKWLATQGGITVVTILVLVFYRRDFFRKIEQAKSEADLQREEKLHLKEVIKENAAINQTVALAIAQNTHATEMLTKSIDTLGERRRNA